MIDSLEELALHVQQEYEASQKPLAMMIAEFARAVEKRTAERCAKIAAIPGCDCAWAIIREFHLEER